tara:strand:+ start:64 stop:603 length:540 start_codon:yes stop_codon:yes gene_type:complete
MKSKLVNLLTISRVFLAFIIFILILFFENYSSALILFFVAGISDYLDGFLARKYKVESNLGEILDPTADKILIVFLFFALAIKLDSFLIGIAGSIIVSREIWISALRDFNSRNNNIDATKVIFISKFKTSLQLLSIFMYLFALTINNMLMIIITDVILIISMLITIYTGYIYTLNSFKE